MISIIIVSFPADAKYLARCFESCANQDVDVEVVFGYAGRLEELPHEAMKAFFDLPKKQVFTVCPDPRHAKMRNMAVAMSDGEWVLLLDSDDWLLPNAIDRVLDEWTTPADVVSCNMEDDKLTVVQPPLCSYADMDLRVLTRMTNPVFTASIIRKHAWQSVGGMDNIKWDDYNLFAKLVAKNYDFIHVNIPLYHHSTRPDSASLRYASVENIAELNRQAIEPLYE